MSDWTKGKAGQIDADSGEHQSRHFVLHQMCGGDQSAVVHKTLSQVSEISHQNDLVCPAKPAGSPIQGAQRVRIGVERTLCVLHQRLSFIYGRDADHPAFNAKPLQTAQVFPVGICQCGDAAGYHS